ncbi:MAG: hypothetical protein KME14_16200 [Tildeniella torsiva UHER 1998/13D]|jgi:hypothetical protein|nr:hypothetical protein [Tildeniella torsiva UHER 1998/13D]
MKAQFEKDLTFINPIEEDHRELRIAELDTSQMQKKEFQALSPQHPILGLVLDYGNDEKTRLAS